jgi:hypothetical protein
MEVLGWLVFIIVAAFDTSSGTLVKSGMAIVLVAYLTNLVLNILSLYFFKKYIWTDDKFQSNVKRLRNKTKCGMPMTYLLLILSGILSHKIIDLLYSNLFELSCLTYKVSLTNKLTPLNYIRYASLACSLLAIVGAAAANYQSQPLQLGSTVFIQSIDLIIVTLLAAIAGILATKRDPEQYEHTIAEKRNEIEEELEHDPIEDDINQFEKEEKGGNQKKYTYSSSIRGTDRPENPLSKRMGGKNPIGVGEEFNLTNAPLDNH